MGAIFWQFDLGITGAILAASLPGTLIALLAAIRINRPA